MIKWATTTSHNIVFGTALIQPLRGNCFVSFWAFPRGNVTLILAPLPVIEWCLFNTKFSSISYREEVTFRCPICTRQTRFNWILYFYIVISLKQRSSGRQVAPLGHIMLLPRKYLILLLSGESTNTNCIAFRLDPIGARTTD